MIISYMQQTTFFYFSEETLLDISCESSAKQTIHMKYLLDSANNLVVENLQNQTRNINILYQKYL